MTLDMWLNYGAMRDGALIEIGVECEVYTDDNRIMQVEVVDMFDDGRIVVLTNTGQHITYEDREALVDAVGNV